MLKSTLGTFGSKFIGAVLNFLVIVLLSQHLGPGGKGEASLILTSIAIILIFGNLIGGAPVVYYTPRKSTKQLLTIAYLWCFVVSILAYALLYFLSIGIDQTWNKSIAVLSLIEGFTAVNLAVLIGKEKVAKNNIVSVVKSVTLVGFLFLLFQTKELASLDDYIIALYASFILSFVVSIVFLYPLIDHKNPEGEASLFKAILRNGVFNQMAYILQFLSFRIGYYIINKEIGEEELGVYSNAISIAESIWLISRSIALVQFSRIVNNDDQQSNQLLTIKLFKLTLILSIIALLVLNSLPSEFYLFVFGSEFGGIKNIILWISPGILAFNLFLIFGHYFSGVDQFKTLTVAAAVGFIVALIGIFLFVDQLGSEGVAFATSISLLVSMGILWKTFLSTTGAQLSHFFIKRGDFAQFFQLIKNLKSR
jgi:O-antigen/teichoic acid export membrane protein